MADLLFSGSHENTGATLLSSKSKNQTTTELQAVRQAFFASSVELDR